MLPISSTTIWPWPCRRMIFRTPPASATRSKEKCSGSKRHSFRSRKWNHSRMIRKTIGHMVYLKTICSGIDKQIQPFQLRLYEQLLALWNLQGGQYECFGRAYRDMRNNGYVPEVFDGKSEYHDVRLDDT